MKTKITVMSVAAIIAGVFIFTRTKNTPPSDLRDAPGSTEFSTDIPVFKQSDKLAIPAAEAVKTDKTNKSAEDEQQKPNQYVFCIQAHTNIDTPDIDPQAPEMKREIFGIFKTAGLEYSYTKETGHGMEIYDCYTITYKPKGELRVRTLSSEISSWMDNDLRTEFKDAAKKADIWVLPYRQWPMDYLGSKEISILRGISADPDLAKKVSELNAEILCTVKMDKEEAVLYIPK